MSGAGQADLAGFHGSPLRNAATRRERSPRRTTEDWATAQQHAISTPVGMTQEQQHITESAVTQIAAGVMSADERISQLEAEARRVAPVLSNMETMIQGMGSTTQSLTDTMAQMEETLVNMMKQITGTQSNLDAFKSHMTNSLAAAEGTLSSSLNGLTQKVQQNDNMIRQVEAMISGSPGAGQASGTSTGGTNFLPWKNMVPSKFGHKPERWREWQEDVRGYFDGTKQGIREVLQSLENENEEQGIEFVRQRFPFMAPEGQALWRALKSLTDEGTEARRIVTSVCLIKTGSAPGPS